MHSRCRHQIGREKKAEVSCSCAAVGSARVGVRPTACALVVLGLQKLIIAVTEENN